LEKYDHQKLTYKNLNAAIFKDYVEEEEDAMSNQSEDEDYQVCLIKDSQIEVSNDAC
jgi:hypothetical protein